ncbi:MAG: hypothetical protein NTW21_24615 [Verrucomicrobia bacterium]|nr:hypothetical protein [Verrucomicrobiota bacterium]
MEGGNRDLSRLPPGLADHGILAAHRIEEGVDYSLDQDACPRRVHEYGKTY